MKLFKISYFITIGFIVLFLLFMIGVELKKYYSDKEYNELILVNSTNKLTNIKEPITKEYRGYRVSNKIYNSLVQMTKSAGRDGILLEINKGYISYSNEQKIYDNNILSFVSQGFDLGEATSKTEETIVKPEYSEYPTGLAINFNKKDQNSNQKMYKWLKENAYKYGFILRYPEGKEDITKVKYSISHYRYVGVKAAIDIHNDNLCLEEYLNLKG